MPDEDREEPRVHTPDRGIGFWTARRANWSNSNQKGTKIMPQLTWKLLTKKRDSSTQGLPPGKEALAFVTNTVTLISGERGAVLVDTFLSVQHSKELLDWVAESGKNLKTVYVTHAHGDHFFGLKLLLDRFPNARAFSTASSVAAMQNQISTHFIKSRLPDEAGERCSRSGGLDVQVPRCGAKRSFVVA